MVGLREAVCKCVKARELASRRGARDPVSGSEVLLRFGTNFSTLKRPPARIIRVFGRSDGLSYPGTRVQELNTGKSLDK